MWRQKLLQSKEKKSWVRIWAVYPDVQFPVNIKKSLWVQPRACAENERRKGAVSPTVITTLARGKIAL